MIKKAMSVFELTKAAMIKRMCEKIDTCIANARSPLDATRYKIRKEIEEQTKLCEGLMKKYNITMDMMNTKFGGIEKVPNTPNFPYIHDKKDYGMLRAGYSYMIHNLPDINPYIFSASVTISPRFSHNDPETMQHLWCHPDIIYGRNGCVFRASVAELKEIFGKDMVHVEVEKEWHSPPRDDPDKIYTYTIDFSKR